MSSRTIEVRRLQPGGAAIGVRAIQRLKAQEGYPTRTPQYFQAFLSKAENVFVVAIDSEPVRYAVGCLLAIPPGNDDEVTYAYPRGSFEDTGWPV